ncbi:MAG: fasciclin domain-containing protein [Thermoplasmatota archaeon]
MKDLIQTAIDNGNLNILISTVQEVGLEDVLRSDGPYTMFAPTDEAFSKLPKKTLKFLLQDKERLTEILTYHIIYGAKKSKEVIKNKQSTTIHGLRLVFDGSGSGTVNAATFLHKDIECKNGVIHIIDQVLIPK